MGEGMRHGGKLPKVAWIVERASSLELIGEDGAAIRTQIYDRQIPLHRDRAYRTLARAARVLGFTLVDAPSHHPEARSVRTKRLDSPDAGTDNS
jgi:hypothetical protein